MTSPAPQKNIYFLSDFHLGAPDHAASLVREKKIVAFLDNIKNKAAEIFILGDIFDFWFEYKHVVPKGFVRMLGKLAEITDSGIPVHVFIGNHDMWMKDYFRTELNIAVYFEPKEFQRAGKTFLIGHGDGLGPGDKGYKFLKNVFRNKTCQALFGALHPSWGIGLANYFSRKSRAKTGNADSVWLGDDNEWLVIFCREYLKQKHADFFVFGHRHFPAKVQLGHSSQYINLGDWISNFTYAVFDGENINIEKWEA